MSPGPLTTLDIGQCLGAVVGSVTDLQQRGADPAETYATQTYIGFSFTLTSAAGNLPTGTHEYYLGTPPPQPADAPTSMVTTPGDGRVSVAFTAPTSTGGATITDYEYQLDGGTWTTASTINRSVSSLA